MPDAYDSMDKPTKGAWVIHHGRKTRAAFQGGAAFPVLDTAGRAATLLSSIAATDDVTLPKDRLEALAKAANFNTILELPPIIELLARKRLIDKSAGGAIAVIGLTTSATARHAAEIFDELSPSKEEMASLVLSETTTNSPIQFDRVSEYIGDQFKIAKNDSLDFVNSASQIGFVDAEGTGVDRLVFNGNLFRRENIEKSKKIIDSLKPDDSQKVNDLDVSLSSNGCIDIDGAVQIIGKDLFDKLLASGMYDLQFVHNTDGEFGFVTKPSAFHKFNDPLVDDVFDLSKALVASLFYGMNKSNYSRGKISMLSALLKKLIRGEDVGPATAIGQDYKVLEEAGVLQVWPDSYGYSMRLLKKDVGEMALKVLLFGNASTENAAQPLVGSMNAFSGPEATRWDFRKNNQGAQSKKGTRNILEALRTGDRL